MHETTKNWNQGSRLFAFGQGEWVFAFGPDPYAASNAFCHLSWKFLSVMLLHETPQTALEWCFAREFVDEHE